MDRGRFCFGIAYPQLGSSRRCCSERFDAEGNGRYLGCGREVGCASRGCISPGSSCVGPRGSGVDKPNPFGFGEARGWQLVGCWSDAIPQRGLSPRVVGRSMADWLAVNAGVSELDLASLKREAPLLIARAAEEERLDWSGFLQQSRQWALKTTS